MSIKPWWKRLRGREKLLFCGRDLFGVFVSFVRFVWMWMWKIENTWWVSFKDGGENNVQFLDVFGDWMMVSSWLMFHGISFFLRLVLHVATSSCNKTNQTWSISVCLCPVFSKQVSVKITILQQIDSETQERKWTPVLFIAFELAFWYQDTGHSFTAVNVSKLFIKSPKKKQGIQYHRGTTCLFCV